MHPNDIEEEQSWGSDRSVRYYFVRSIWKRVCYLCYAHNTPVLCYVSTCAQWSSLWKTKSSIRVYFLTLIYMTWDINDMLTNQILTWKLSPIQPFKLAEVPWASGNFKYVCFAIGSKKHLLRIFNPVAKQTCLVLFRALDAKCLCCNHSCIQTWIKNAC